MAVNTLLFDFSVESSMVKTESAYVTLAKNIEEVLREFIQELKLVNEFNLAESFVKIYTSVRAALVNLRIYDNGLITLNIEYFRNDDSEPLVSYQTWSQLQKELRFKVLAIKTSHMNPAIVRQKIPRMFPSSDERILEYDIDELVFEQITPYQKVQILHSKSMGNMLVLDDLQNLAESDLIYTETLMQRGKENYESKEVVILGGGDGALLYELLKEKPKEVVMLEIDDVVMKACSKHMRSVCGDVLDKLEGPNYKIIVGDCMVTLEQYIKEGRKFDYIFGDLTDIPIEENESPELWSFIIKIMKMSFKVLKPDGKFMTHVTGTCSPQAIEAYKQKLLKFNPPLKFTTDKAFVPSFLEEWVFCQISLVDLSTAKE
ncbi:spermine synthase isoform X1 [Anthonomus grandis grandis]|uniref:spermine synthase isoform X1 n=1 Tax=Anthonomus grandis grandis TaxID=2921223 RepID=UPI0021669DF7|nr:spermine synthase isoform X1 [Anthonomus grandis grandis]